MAGEDEAGAAAGPGRKTYVRYTARLGREICERVAAGERVQVICAEPGMPLATTVCDWAREHPDFGVQYHRAKAFSAREGLGRNSTYCEVVAHEICVRTAEGQTLTEIGRDPAMPALGTMIHWQKRSPEFAEALAIARQARAEGLADLGWQMALEATPQTAYLTRVQLAQLRWTAAIISPKVHGRHKALAPPEPPAQPTSFAFRHFHLERNDETGQHRVVRYTPHPETMQPVRDSEGPWTDYAGNTVRHSFGPAASRPEPASAEEDPEGWL